MAIFVPSGYGAAWPLSIVAGRQYTCCEFVTELRGKYIVLMAVHWYWRKEPPRLWSTTLLLALASIASGILLDVSVPYWGQKRPDETHPAKVLGGFHRLYFVHRYIGWYMTHWGWIFALFLILALFIAAIHRKDLRRI